MIRKTLLVISLLLLVATVGVWVRSYRAHDTHLLSLSPYGVVAPHARDGGLRVEALVGTGDSVWFVARLRDEPPPYAYESGEVLPNSYRRFAHCRTLAVNFPAHAPGGETGVNVALFPAEFPGAPTLAPNRPVRRPLLTFRWQSWSLARRPAGARSGRPAGRRTLRKRPASARALAYRIQLPLPVPAALFGLASMILAGPLLRARARRRSGRCPTCGYDLTGNVWGTCPECGALAPAP